MTATLSTHVLDATRGEPATGLTVTLSTLDGATLAAACTDADGRIRFPAGLESGPYQLTFAVGKYFARLSTPSFYPVVVIVFTVTTTETGTDHHHVPLLLSPFAYSTYRGS